MGVMDEEIWKGLGFWLIALTGVAFTMVAFYLGRLINGLPAEIVSLINLGMGATETFLILIIRKWCKLPTYLPEE